MGPSQSKIPFDFISLWNITERIYLQDPNDGRLFKGANGPSLTFQTCIDYAGPGYHDYDASVIWTRLSTWKFPLVQLIVLFPRPPLGLGTELFVLLHLLGDPIDTIKNLLLKLSSCQAITEEWRGFPKRHQGHQNPPRDSDANNAEDSRGLTPREYGDPSALSLMADAYGEWDRNSLFDDVLQELLRYDKDLWHDEEQRHTEAQSQADELTHAGERERAQVLENDEGERHDEARERLSRFQDAIGDTANALAADRATKYLPTIVAMIIFAATFGIAIFRTVASEGTGTLNSSIFINLEAHNIAFSTLYFWLVPAAMLGSVIGVSQTEQRIPRILQRFHNDLRTIFPAIAGRSPELKGKMETLEKDVQNADARVFTGGIYSWQPWHWRCDKDSSKLQNWWRCHRFLPFLIVFIPTISGTLISSLVPPGGWDCRVTGQVAIFLTWVVSAEADILLNFLLPPNEHTRTKLFWFTFIKDLSFTIGTLGLIVATIVGIFNRCSCWTSWGHGGLTLPQREDVDSALRYRLTHHYTPLVFSSMGFELVIVPLWICFRYRRALKVFIQRDDNLSNIEWLLKAWRWILSWKTPLQDAKYKLKRSFTLRSIRSDQWGHV